MRAVVVGPDGTPVVADVPEPDGPGDMALLQENNGFSFERFPFTAGDSSFQLPRDGWWRLSAA